MPRLEKSGMQGRAVGIDQALLGVCLCVAGIEKAEIARREQRAERGTVDAVGILAAALQNLQLAAAKRVFLPGFCCENFCSAVGGQLCEMARPVAVSSAVGCHSGSSRVLTERLRSTARALPVWSAWGWVSTR